jgi:hypothetical protein
MSIFVLGRPRARHRDGGQLPFGLGDLAQLKRFAQPGLALDKPGRHGPGRLLLGCFEEVHPRDDANREDETLAQPADQHVKIEVLRREAKRVEGLFPRKVLAEGVST